MANHKSALKRIRSSAKKQIRNRIYVSRTRSEVRAAREQVAAGNAADARVATLTAIRTLDMAARKGIIHANNAARRKSRLMKQLNKLTAAAK